jgi:hypothetical protein
VEGIFPTVFKNAQITPLLKKPGLDEGTPSNYRPISNLVTISKVLEKLFLARIKPFILSSPNFSNLQSGYRKHHSTETALLRIYDDIYKMVDNQKGALLISLDLSAAFDVIPHDRLIKRLSNCFGLSGAALSWIESYLSNRHQFIKIQDHFSPTTIIESGVPQGSVLGPFLFSCYASPLSKIIPANINFHQYADDTQLYCSVSTADFSDDAVALQDCVSLVAAWFWTNGMLLNADKSEATLFSTIQQAKKLAPNSTVDIAGERAELSSDVRSLGVVMDDELKMDKHVNSICKKCYYHIRALRHIRPCLSDTIAGEVGRCIVNSNLDYCNSLLARTSKQNLNKLQRIQNSLIRVVCRLGWRDSVTAHRRALHWLPVASRIEFKIAVLTFKCRKQFAPAYLSELIIDYVPARLLRSSDKDFLVVPTTKNVMTERAFSFSGPVIWNSLPFYLRHETSLDCFKNKLKTFLFNRR